MSNMSDKIMGIMERMLPTCKTVTKQVSDSMEHKLPLFDRLKVNLHLMGCESCSLYRKQLLILQGLLNKYLEKMESEEYADKKTLSTDASKRIKKILKDKTKGKF